MNIHGPNRTLISKPNTKGTFKLHSRAFLLVLGGIGYWHDSPVPRRIAWVARRLIQWPCSFSHHACHLEEAVCFVFVVDQTIVNVLITSPRGELVLSETLSTKNPLAKRPKRAKTRVAVEDKNSQLEWKETKQDETERPKRCRSQASSAGIPPKVDFTEGLDVPMLKGPPRCVGYLL